MTLMNSPDPASQQRGQQMMQEASQLMQQTLNEIQAGGGPDLLAPGGDDWGPILSGGYAGGEIGQASQLASLLAQLPASTDLSDTVLDDQGGAPPSPIYGRDPASYAEWGGVTSTGPFLSGPSATMYGPEGSLVPSLLDHWGPLLADQGLATTDPDLARLLYGALWGDGFHNADNQFDPTGRRQLLTAGDQFAGTLSGLSPEEYLRQSGSGNLAGLSRLLAQPFNILLTWGPNVFDLDLHMTGPQGISRFHIYYAAPGALDAPPFAQLVQDCICTSGSEVIQTSQLQRGGVYRISAFDFGDQSATSTQLSNGGVSFQVVRGGTAQGVGQGTTIVGGHVLLSVTPPANQQGNTWTAVEIDPATGRIFTVGQIGQSNGSANVH